MQSGSVGKERKSELCKLRPSDLFKAYNTDLQDTAMAAMPTVDCCRSVPSPTLGELAEISPGGVDETTGQLIKNVALMWMQSQLLVVSLFCGVREKMSEWQSTAVCRQILSQYPWLSMIEFILFCARLRSQRYGKFYGAIDPSEIMGALEKFVKERQHDVWRRMEEEERAEREKRDEESRKNCISFEEYKRRKAAGMYDD